MSFPVVGVAERDHKLIAGLAAKRARLCEAALSVPIGAVALRQQFPEK
jgi:hypothetical protein